MTYLGIKAGHDWRYLTKQVGRGKENYYTKAVERGEPPGRWNSELAHRLGLSGEVSEQDMEALFGDFIDPRDEKFRDRKAWGQAARLGRRPPKYATPEDILKEKLAAEPGASKERERELRQQAQKEARSAVMFLDATFSVPKSVSIAHVAFRAREVAARRGGNEEEAALWAGRAEAIEAAVWAGNNASLEYLAKYAGFARAGYHGNRDDVGGDCGRWVDAHDIVVASFFQNTSRSEDMQIHIHNPHLNRVPTVDEDGREVWRSLDSKAFYRARGGAGMFGGLVMRERLIGSLGAQWVQRADGHGWELAGVDPAAIKLFSTRSGQKNEKTKELVDKFGARYGRPPSALELSRLKQQATLATRPRKSPHAPTVLERYEQHEQKLRQQVDSSLYEVAEQVIAHSGRPPAEAGDPYDFNRTELIERALAAVQDTKAGWTRHDLTRAIIERLPTSFHGAAKEQLDGLVESLADEGLREAGVLQLTAPELVPVGPELRLASGESMYRAPGAAELYATRGQMRAEQRLQAAAADRDTEVAVVSPHRVEAQFERLAAEGMAPAADQAAALRGVLTSGRAVEVIIGPAGTGKSYTMGTLARIWEAEVPGGHEGGRARVFGLSTAENAAQVLAEEGIDRSANIERWLMSQKRLDEGRAGSGDRAWRLGSDDLVIVDEASMVPTPQFAEIQRYCAEAGAKLLGVGDDGQLGAPGPAGGLRLLAEHAPVYHLQEVRRFVHDWEKAASLRLRAGDITVVDEYARHGRIRDGGTRDEAIEQATRGWLADTVAGRRALLVVPTNDLASELSARIRERFVALGRVQAPTDDLPRLGHRDAVGCVAGVGDVIQTRKNDWKTRDGAGRAVINRDTYRVVGVGPDGSLTVRRATWERDTEQLGEQLLLRAEYVAEHVTLGYALTAHGAEGQTVTVGRLILDPGRTSPEGAYVGLTRGTEENVAYAITRAPDAETELRDIDPADIDPQQRPESHREPTAVLADILQRARTDAQLSATEIMRASQDAAASLATLGVRWIDDVQAETTARYRAIASELTGDNILPERHHARLVADEAAGPLWRLLRTAELSGHEPRQVLTAAIRARELDTAESVAKVLHDRIKGLFGRRLVPTADSYTERTPEQPITHRGRDAQTVAEAMDARVAELGERVIEQQPEWATRWLGTVPDDPIGRLEWSRAAGMVQAYREQYGHADEHDALGPAPRTGQPEGRAAWHTAWRALGGPEHLTDENAMSDAQLHEKLGAWQREKDWEPPHMADRMGTLAQLRDDHRESARLLANEAQYTTDEQRAAELGRQAEAYESLAASLDVEHQRLGRLQTVYDRWYEQTRPVEDAARRAREELALRGKTPDTAPNVTPTDVVADTPAGAGHAEPIAGRDEPTVSVETSAATDRDPDQTEVEHDTSRGAERAFDDVLEELADLVHDDPQASLETVQLLADLADDAEQLRARPAAPDVQPGRAVAVQPAAELDAETDAEADAMPDLGTTLAETQRAIAALRELERRRQLDATDRATTEEHVTETDRAPDTGRADARADDLAAEEQRRRQMAYEAAEASHEAQADRDSGIEL